MSGAEVRDRRLGVSDAVRVRVGRAMALYAVVSGVAGTAMYLTRGLGDELLRDGTGARFPEGLPSGGSAGLQVGGRQRRQAGTVET